MQQSTNTVLDLQMRRRQLLFGLASAVVLPAASPAASHARPGLIGVIKTLRVAVIDLAPWAQRDEHGRVKGVFIDLARQLEQTSGVALELLVVPYPRAVAMLASNDADMMFSVGSATLERVALPLATLADDDIIMLFRAGERLQSLADLRGKTVGHVRGAEYDAAFSADTSIIKYATRNYEQDVQMLLLKRIDAAIGVRTGLQYAARMLDADRGSLAPALLLRRAQISLYLGRRHADPRLAEKLQAACATLYQRQAMRQLVHLYCGA